MQLPPIKSYTFYPEKSKYTSKKKAELLLELSNEVYEARSHISMS